ncbi:O-methyltransferase [Mangrovimonas aestuarii]|uniref:O-methyltransferase n=1 Tax=Mangrovimonas aestuarii TaxID=3018443 RepID=UPI00237843B3|nr:class I SAM-dependent methyltransferase [Mangrovimonas aestuarii]
MWYQIKAYFKFLGRSTNQHGIHSPFVYSLVTRCFYDRKKYTEYNTLNRYRQSLLNDKIMIEVEDFGAGSRIFKSNKRKISDIAKIAGITKKRAKLLFRLSRYFKPEQILELGASLGMGSCALHLGHLNAELTTIEGCTNTAAMAKKQFENFGFNSISLIPNTFEQVLNDFNKPIDLAYIDGHHSKSATLNYFEKLLPLTHNDTVLIFDDIHLSEEMSEAWEDIKQHPQVTVTIDTFFWGLVFFRKEQRKEHFVVRM